MSNGFLYWYEDDWTPQHAASRITALETAGLSLPHHNTGQIIMVGTDPTGDIAYRSISRSDLVAHAAVDADDDFSFKYWLELDVDVFCTIKRLASDLAVQRFYLDGLTTEQQRFVIGVVFDQIHAAPATTRALIVDLVGRSEDEDWDELITGTTDQFLALPDATVLPRAIAAQHPELQAGPPMQVGDLLGYDPHDLLPTTPTV